MTRVSFAIQAHPSRAEMAATLAERLPGCEVVFDPDPDYKIKSPWRTYRAALERTPAWATHRLVVQDDAELCAYFAEAATLACAAAGDKLVAFFVAGSPAQYAHKIWEACDRGDVFADLGPESWVPVIACAWPVWAIEPALRFVDEQGWPEGFCADDEIVGRACRGIGAGCLATVPSLVEHPDMEPSVIGKRRAMGGADISRVAACMIGGDCDARELGWLLPSAATTR